VAGRTGGPFFPFPAVIDALPEYQPIIVGIKNGFEDRVAEFNNYPIYYLPQTRLRVLSFKREKLSETLYNYLDLIPNIAKLLWSICKSIYLLIRFRPLALYTTGSFLAVPLAIACRITNFLHLTQTKIIVHQQDPLPGFSNNVIAPWAHLLSCVFEYTRETFPKYKDATITPNPIQEKVYAKFTREEKLILSEKQPALSTFVYRRSNKPLLLVFGGGSGSEDINVWLVKNLTEMLEHFRIVHLTGILQKKTLITVDHADYFRMEALLNGEMPSMLKKADVVLCRSGLATITELLYLSKPAFLVPLPSTHQEINAQVVADKFYILDQKDRLQWAETIITHYPSFFKDIEYNSKKDHTMALKKYYEQLRATIG
jgi:UDP-N-acetylglucosamine--N-acetylmuramyl-(pentapeptide) pyrophosphoryl-undecaprenol N-acetylglucosamine transferase